MTKQQLAIIIGKNLLKYRTENNYTQEELAEKVGISTSFYANLERGNKSMSLLVLRNLADALQVSTDALLYECNPQCHMQSIYTILRNKSNSFIIAAEKMIRLLQKILNNHFVRYCKVGVKMSGATMPDDRIEQLYQEMFAKLYQYALRITSNPSLAEEAVQNTFCIACSKKDSLFSSDNPRGWLMNTLKNVIRNMLRDRAKLAISVFDIMEENNISSTDEVNIDVLYSDISNNEDFQLLKWIALDKYSIREISDNLGISMEACKKRVQRAKKRLQGHIKNNI